MVKFSRLVSFILAIIISIPMISQQITDEQRKDSLPTLRSRVNDLESLFSKSEKESLDNLLLSIEKKTKAQVAVLIVATTGSETIEEYSLRVANSWKLGRKGINDGVLLVIALQDHRIRIEVGLGLENTLTDEECKRILDESILPQFKKGNFYDGLHGGILEIQKLIELGPTPVL